MKPTQHAPIGTTATTGARNWQTTKNQQHYADEHERIFGPRKKRPGLTVTVWRDGKRKEYRNAEKLSPSECGIRMRKTGICQ